MILVIDNYDSFTYNLVQALGALGAELQVRRNDAIDAAGVGELQPAGVVLSPGPGQPQQAGCCCEIVQRHGDSIPILGVCLGHQAVAAALGGVVVRAPEVVHGKTASVTHDGAGLFDGLPQSVEVARYHSLVVDRPSLPDVLEVTAWTADELVMGLSHREWPLHGVQFHPESIATANGPEILQNFLTICGARARGV